MTYFVYFSLHDFYIINFMFFFTLHSTLHVHTGVGIRPADPAAAGQKHK